MSKATSLKVIVDTSVWIDFLQGNLNQKDREILTVLIESEEIAITDIIKHELLIGTHSPNEYGMLEELLSPFNEISILPEWRKEFNYFSFELRKKGLLGKYTDASIAFLSKKFEYPVYSFDVYFEKLAQKGLIKILSEKDVSISGE